MFGHQDNTDNNGYQDEHYQQEIDHHIQEFNDSGTNAASAPPANDNQPADNDLPMVVDQPAPPYHDDNNPHPVNLPDEPNGQAVDLVNLKTKALDELYPIIHKLDLSAEDNFKTLMMMIQATDNKDLIGQAYEAAERIEDEGNRAKALLDIVNEINYFTNHPSIDQ